MAGSAVGTTVGTGTIGTTAGDAVRADPVAESVDTAAEAAAANQA